VYLQPKRIDWRLSSCSELTRRAVDEIVNSLWRRLKSFYTGHTDVGTYSIDIPTNGTNAGTRGHLGGAPILATRTAFGVMKNAEQNDNPKIAVVSDQEVRLAIEQTKMTGQRCVPQYYYLLDPNQFPEAFAHFTDKQRDAIKEAVKKFNTLDLDPYPTFATLSETKLYSEIALGQARRFLLIAHSDTLPNDAFVSVYQRGIWYYILDSDEISKRTLGLIAYFNTVQAVPSQTPPLQGSISVGARP
jgi:hypothetical protein